MTTPKSQTSKILFDISGGGAKSAAEQQRLPTLLRTTTRDGGQALDPLLEGIRVEQRYELAATTRGEAGETRAIETEKAELLAVETEDGTTLFIRSDALAEAVARINPEAINDLGEVDFNQFRDPNATARGLGDVMWKTVSVLRLPSDGLLEEAKEKAREWAKEKLGDLALNKAYDVGSFLGAKALMWKIESHLAGRPGLYQWPNAVMTESDRCLKDDPRLKLMADGKPALILIHGTGSYTVSAFAELRSDKATWERLQTAFPAGIFGYEHRTFSESPSENALALLNNLPKGARVSLVSHSRGGLVADLLCLGEVKSEVIDAYRIDTRNAEDPEGLEQEARDERSRLREITSLLTTGQIKVERYVRIASPSRGTRFLSENLDAALSDFLNLLQWGGGALVGTVAGAVGGPVAAERFGKGASSGLGVLKRLTLEIAGRRIDPRLVPGIAAMRIDSPLARFLANPDTRRRDGIQMAVIAGDTEFDGLGLSNFRRRVANLFCDWRLFDKNDNDLVVDTDSMYAGLGFREGAKYLYEQDDSVTHFRYFANPSSRAGLRDWLVETDVERLTQFQPLTSAAKLPWKDREDLQKQRGGSTGPRPVVILIPGIMGSHIEINHKKDKTGSGNRIWFDVPSLMLGRLRDISDVDAQNAAAEDIFEMFYGDLADYLTHSHNVIRCPYDWRHSLKECAKTLRDAIEEAARTQPGQPIRLLAHSMGGLVTRALMKEFPAAWQKVVDSGGRLLMLGTPNNGSHLMVHTLLGKSDAMRKLATMDTINDMQSILDIVAAFPGSLSLLPRPGFIDTGNDATSTGYDYYHKHTWEGLQTQNKDFWFGDKITGVPDEKRLEAAKKYWESLPVGQLSNPDRIAYVYGQADKTPCGLKVKGGRLQLLFTPYGDGSVTWQSGRIEELDQRSWYMPVEHADLTGEEEYFPAIVELLEKGATAKLGRLPRMRGDTATSFVLEAEPPVMANSEELARAMLGSGPRRRKTAKTHNVLKVGVHAGDLSYIDQPVLCGHYIGDAISGAEAKLDEKLNGILSERERLGVYASEIGTSAIVLRPPSRDEVARGSLPGAVIVGLGQYNGQLSARQITETVRSAVVRYLLQLRDVTARKPEDNIKLYSVLIGWGSTANISISESVAAITRGVLEANRQFRDGVGKSHQQGHAVNELYFIDIYRDAAITAAYSALNLPELLATDLKRMGARLEPAPVLNSGEGIMERLYTGGDYGYWSRLIVTDADASEIECPPECYEVRCQSSLPREMLRQLCKQTQDPNGELSNINADVAPSVSGGASPVKPRYYPERLKYLLLSTRARAETILQRRQPGLVEDIISKQRHNPSYDRQLGHTLFQLMVPLDFKAAAREQSRLLLVLDAYTANLPWELLQVDGEALVLRMRMIRQLATSRYRPTVRTANSNTVCIIVNPSTSGFNKRFPGKVERLDSLNGAEREGSAIAEKLRNVGWNDIVITAPEREALDIFNVLYERPYRVLVIGAHGLFEAEAMDGRVYSGVVLSDGLLITAVEISQMEVVPEVVFLSCCHLGSISNPYSSPNQLAYSLARELIEMGVRCVVAAGWAVNDDAACTFATTFFDSLCAGYTFGDAVFDARKAAHRQHPSSNTWGAYQAYGDPSYRLQIDAEGLRDKAASRYVAMEELLSALQKHRTWRNGLLTGEKRPDYAKESQWVHRQLANCPADWSQQPEILQAMAELYADLGVEGFDAARAAYQKAIQVEDKQSRVAISSIEQLANLEARRGGKLAEDGQFEPGMQLINCAIRRILGLADSVRTDGASDSNVERQAILGSAYKLKASALAWRNSPWEEISKVLAESAQAYRSTVTGDPALNPYNTLNYLPLAWLSKTLPESDEKTAIELARLCGASARKRYADSKTFWDAVMSADAEMTAWLMGGDLDETEIEAAQAKGQSTIHERLDKRYQDSVLVVPQSDREWNSVVKQWRSLALFLRLRGADGDMQRAEILDSLADRYLPRQARAKSSTDPVDPNSTANPLQENTAAETNDAEKPRKPRPSKKS